MTRASTSYALFLFLLLVDALCAAELPAPLREVKPELRPLGSAALNWFGLHVYDIALFAPDEAYTTSGTAVLSIRYDISITSLKLQQTTLKEWRRMNLADETKRQRWIKQVALLWPDVKPGDTLTTFRLQDGPTRFYFGDRLLGEVADPEFGPAFLAIWLGADCSYPKVRDKLLGAKEADEKKGR